MHAAKEKTEIHHPTYLRDTKHDPSHRHVTYAIEKDNIDTDLRQPSAIYICIYLYACLFFMHLFCCFVWKFLLFSPGAWQGTPSGRATAVRVCVCVCHPDPTLRVHLLSTSVCLCCTIVFAMGVACCCVACRALRLAFCTGHKQQRGWCV